MSSIQEFLNFIAWENFTNPQVYWLWLKGILSIFLFLFAAVLISYAVFPKAKEALFRSQTGEMVFRATTGIAMLAFLSTLLLFTQTLYAVVFLVLFHGFIVIAALRHRRVTFTAFSLLKNVLWNHKWLWLLFLVASLPSLLPPLWIDETSYHISYPLLWVENGGIYVEDSMRYPLYSFGIHSVLVIGAFLDSTTFMHLFSWLSGVLATLGIWALLRRFQVWRPLQYIGALAFFFTPVVQQYLNISYIDVQMMLLTFMSAYALIILHNDSSNRNLQYATAGILALFVGGKPTAAFTIPLIFFLVLYQKNFRQMLPFLITFSVLGSVWYLRNIYINADPVPPSLNMLLGREDLYWARSDYEYIMQDIAVHHDWTWWNIWYKLPWELMTAGPNSPLRYWPHLSYVWFFAFSVVYIFRVWRNAEKRIVFSIALFNAIVWLAVSYFTRYAHFLPLAAVSVAIMLNEIVTLARRHLQFTKWQKAALALIFIGMMMGPKHYAYSYFKNNFNKKVPVTRAETREFVGWGDPSVLQLIDRLEELGVEPGSRIYGYPLTPYKWYVIKAGYLPVGDGVNKFRWVSFDQSYRNGKLCQFLIDAKTPYLWIDKTYHNNAERFDFSETDCLKVLFEDERLILFKHQNFPQTNDETNQ